jgi:glucosylceramidase
MKFTNYILTTILLPLFSGCSNKTVVTEPPTQNNGNDTTSAKVVYWLTTPDESSLLKRQPALSYTKSSNGDININIDTNQSFQEMDGFGYTLTGGSAQMLKGMSKEIRTSLLKELFGDDESSIGISYLRLSIGASDLNETVFTYDDVPAGQSDSTLEHFSLSRDTLDLIPVLKEIVAIAPHIKFISTPWTPPVWMKDNQNSVGGSLKKEYYPAYASYFVKYIDAMKQHGINITAITPQNEPLHPGNNPSLLMQAEEQAEFIKNHLGPAFRTAGIATKIIVYDHNCDRPDYPLTILNDPEARPFVDGSAFHMYAGEITALSQVHNAFPDKNVYFTEQYTSNTSQFGGDLQWHIKNLVIGAPRNWSKTVFEWNLANDINFQPHTPGGCTTCRGALTINGSGVKRNVGYYIIAHISKFVPQRSVRIGSNISGNIQNVAFRTPEGKKVLVAQNENQTATSFNILIGNKAVKASLPPAGVATFVMD